MTTTKQLSLTDVLPSVYTVLLEHIGSTHLEGGYNFYLLERQSDKRRGVFYLLTTELQVSSAQAAEQAAALTEAVAEALEAVESQGKAWMTDAELREFFTAQEGAQHQWYAYAKDGPEFIKRVQAAYL